MKKSISGGTMVVFAMVLFAACTPEPPLSRELSVEKGGAGAYRIGFANASISNSWRVKMRDMLLEAAARRGNVHIFETNAQDDASRMNANIESMLQQNLDAILVTPVVEDAANPGIEMAFASGIPVIVFDRHCSTGDFSFFVGYSDRQNGVETAKLMVEALIKKNGAPRGNLLAFDSVAGSSTDRLIREGWDEVFSQYPDIKIIARQYTDFEVGKGKAFMEDSLARFRPGEIDGFVSQDGGVTLGAFDAIDEAGRGNEGLLCTNADGINGVCRLIREGRVYGLTQFPCGAGVDALTLAIDVLEGRKPPAKEVMIDSIVVTAANVDEYLIPGGDDYDWTL